MRLVAALVVALALVGCLGPKRYGGDVRRDQQLEATLGPADVAFTEGKFDDGITLLLDVPATDRNRPAFRAFTTKHEAKVRQEVERRASQKAWGGAFVLVSLGAPIFPSLDAKRAEVARAWADSLRPAIEDAEKKQRPAAAVVLRAALAAATGDAGDRTRARDALAALRRQHRIAIEVAGTGELRGVQSAVAALERFDSSAGHAAERVVVTLGRSTDKKDVQRGQASVQVERGTRSVPNPARADIEARVADHEDRIQNLQEQRQAEQESPSRSQGNIEMFDYQISVERGDLDEAKADLAATPATIEEANIEEVPYDIEIHTLTVSRDVSVEVIAPWKGDLASQRTTVKTSKTDHANAANRSLGIEKDPVDLPAPAALAGDLDQATMQWLGGALDKIALQSYRSLLVDDLGGDGLALVNVLAPEGMQKGHVEKLAKALQVPMADRLITALAADHMDSPFAPSTRVAVAVKERPARTSTSTPAPAGTSTHAPAGGKTPAPTGSKAPPQTAITTKTPTPAAPPEDPLVAKAGYNMKVVALEVRVGTKIVLAVDRDGVLTSGATKIAVVRANGVLEDSRGKVVMAISKQGEMWTPRQTKPAGRLSASELEFPDGATLSVDTSGHFVQSARGVTYVSEAVLSPSNASTRQLATLVGWLGVGKLRMKKK